MSTAPTPPGTAIAPIALTGPLNCIAFTSGTALMIVKDNAAANHTQRMNLDFIEFSRSCEINFRNALRGFQLLGVSMNDSETGGTNGIFTPVFGLESRTNGEINRI